MNAFQTEFAASAWLQLKATFGQTASYKPPSASASTITGKTVTVNEQVQMNISPLHGADTVERTATVRCDPADIPQPLIGGQFQIGSTHAAGIEYWTITGEPIMRAGIWTCPCNWRRELRAGERSAGGTR